MLQDGAVKTGQKDRKSVCQAKESHGSGYHTMSNRKYIIKQRIIFATYKQIAASNTILAAVKPNVWFKGSGRDTWFLQFLLQRTVWRPFLSLVLPKKNK